MNFPIDKTKYQLCGTSKGRDNRVVARTEYKCSAVSIKETGQDFDTKYFNNKERKQNVST